MIVCSCSRVSCRDVRAACDQGACSLRGVAKATAAGTVCGGCIPSVREILEQHRGAAPAAVAEVGALAQAS